MADVPQREFEVVHQLKNELSIIIGFCDILLAELPQGDRVREDIGQMHKAGQSALALVPKLVERMR